MLFKLKKLSITSAGYADIFSHTHVGVMNRRIMCIGIVNKAPP